MSPALTKRNFRPTVERRDPREIKHRNYLCGTGMGIGEIKAIMDVFQKILNPLKSQIGKQLS